MAIVVAVLNSKGGSGKSTLATNLARAFQLGGAEGAPARVLIADSDPQGTARDWRRVQGDAVQEDSDLGDGLPVVVGIDRPTLERDVPEVAHAFDYVVIDGMAKLHQMAVSAIKAADFVLIPVQPSAADIWAAGDLVDMIRTRQELTGGRPAAAFVVSRQITGTTLASEIGDALRGYGLPVLEARTSQRVAYPEALSRGSTVLDDEPAGKAAGEVRAIAREVLSLLPVPAAP